MHILRIPGHQINPGQPVEINPPFFELFAMRTLLLAMILATSVNAQTNTITFQSSATQTTLLELYTSEGCSSCPPAETQFSRLKKSPGLWKDFVPVAFH